MPPCCHVPFHCFSGFDVDDAREEEGFAMFASEVLERERERAKVLAGLVEESTGLGEEAYEGGWLPTRLIISS
jgi:hypothetical protein